MRPAAIALNYSVKKYTERRTIIIIELTSVGLAHTRPNPNPHYLSNTNSVLIPSQQLLWLTNSVANATCTFCVL